MKVTYLGIRSAHERVWFVERRYLLLAPPNEQVWHKAFFLGRTGRRAVAHTRPEFPRNAYGPVGIPLIRGASGAGRWTQPPRREWKPGGKAPWGRRKIFHSPSHTRPDLRPISMADRNDGLENGNRYGCLEHIWRGEISNQREVICTYANSYEIPR